MLGSRVREVRGWRALSLRQAAALAGLSSSVWGQVERGDKPVGNRRTLEAMARVLRVHPSEVTGQPWAPRDQVSSEAHAGLIAMETALERYDLGAVSSMTLTRCRRAGCCICPAALAAAAQADHDTAATHLDEASALAARMDTEAGTWAHLFFGVTTVGIWRTSLAVELGEYGHAVRIAKAVHPELLPSTARQAVFWAELGRALVTSAKTREKGVRVLRHAEQLAPQRIYHDVFVRETVADLLRQARRDAGGQQLRGLATRLGVTQIG